MHTAGGAGAPSGPVAGPPSTPTPEGLASSPVPSSPGAEPLLPSDPDDPGELDDDEFGELDDAPEPDELAPFEEAF
jgi:hypothetical protein